MVGKLPKFLYKAVNTEETIAIPVLYDPGYDFSKEQINRSNRFIRAHEFITPNFKRTPITCKFYSKYDTRLEESDKGKVEYYYKMIGNSIENGPREKFDQPMIESHK